MMNNALKRWPLVTASAKDGLSCRRRQWRRNQWTVVGGGRVGDSVLVGDGGLGRSGERSIGERGSSETDILLIYGYHTRSQHSRGLCKLSHFHIPFFVYLHKADMAFSRPPANFKKLSWLSAWRTPRRRGLIFLPFNIISFRVPEQRLRQNQDGCAEEGLRCWRRND